MNTARTNPLPCLIARWLPTCAPATLQTAIARPSSQKILPVRPKSRIAARLAAAFTIFAEADACRKSSPNTRTNRKTRKLPVSKLKQEAKLLLIRQRALKN